MQPEGWDGVVAPYSWVSTRAARVGAGLPADASTTPLSALHEHLRASPQGLASGEARRRLAEVGPNEPARRRRGTALAEVVVFLVNPLVIILILACIVSAILGDPVNAAIIIVMVVLSVVLNFVQSYRSQRAADRLREQVAPTASVLRDGAWGEIPRRDLVPGNVIRLSAGDRVPADARLIEARDLHVQQAALTGESMPVEKEATDSPAPARQLAEARNLVFLGTSIVSGTGLALVVATGPAATFGDIAARLGSRPPETEFERGTRQFALLIMRTVFFLVLFVMLATAMLHRSPLESLLFAVALAVGLTPEFLPMITHRDAGAGGAPDGATPGHRQASRRHRGLREPGDPAQRQDRDPDDGRDAARPVPRPARPARRAPASPRLRQQCA